MEFDVSELSLPQKVGQVFCPYFHMEDGLEQVEHFVRDCSVGALHVPGGSAMVLASVLEKLQGQADVPFLACANLEGGYQELLGITQFPCAMALGAAGSKELSFQIGLALGKEAKSHRLDWLFTPVVDVNTNPKNPIVNTRSFGDDVENVIELGTAYCAGLAEAGVLATAKHYPGHGSTEKDSHLSCVHCRNDRRTFRDKDLEPFARLAAAGVPTIMTAHLVVEHVDSLMATFSRTLLHDILRKELGFQGIVVSDALIMGAVTETLSPEEAAAQAFLAGCDVLIVGSREMDALFSSFLEGAKRGQIPMSRLDEAVERILRAKQKTFASQPLPCDPKQHAALAKEVAAKSITLWKNENGLFPLGSRNRPKKLTLLAVGGDGWSRESFLDLLKEKGLRCGISAEMGRVSEIQKEPGQVVVVAIFKRVKFWSHEIGLSQEEKKSIRKILGRHPTIVVLFGNPYVLGELGPVPSCIAAYDWTWMSIESAAEALFGEIEISGTMPVKIK